MTETDYMIAEEIREYGMEEIMGKRIDEFPNNISDVMKLLIHCANEDWTKVGDAAKPLLDIEDIRELSKKAGMKPSI